MVDQYDIEPRVRGFLSTIMGADLPGPDDDYFSLGLMNSLLALELVGHVEHTFGITVEVADLDLDNFRTMNRIARFVRRKLTVPT